MLHGGDKYFVINVIYINLESSDYIDTLIDIYYPKINILYN